MSMAMTRRPSPLTVPADSARGDGILATVRLGPGQGREAGAGGALSGRANPDFSKAEPIQGERGR